MKKILIFLMFIIILSCSTYNKSNHEAIKVTYNNLEIIKSFIEGKTEDLTAERVGVISFFEILTGIESESDANFVGKFWPTMNDYYRWNEWLDKNKEHLSLDSNNQVIYIKEGKK